MFNILHQLVGAGQAAMQNTDYLVHMCVCVRTHGLLPQKRLGSVKTDCTVFLGGYIRLCMHKGSGEINCLLETLLCFADNRQVLGVCVCVYAILIVEFIFPLY